MRPSSPPLPSRSIAAPPALTSHSWGSAILLFPSPSDANAKLEVVARGCAQLPAPFLLVPGHWRATRLASFRSSLTPPFCRCLSACTRHCAPYRVLYIVRIVPEDRSPLGGGTGGERSRWRTRSSFLVRVENRLTAKVSDRTSRPSRNLQRQHLPEIDVQHGLHSTGRGILVDQILSAALLLLPSSLLR